MKISTEQSFEAYGLRQSPLEHPHILDKLIQVHGLLSESVDAIQDPYLRGLVSSLEELSDIVTVRFQNHYANEKATESL